MIDLRKSITRHFAIKGDCNLGLLDHRQVLVRLSNREDFVEVYSRAVSFIIIKEKGVTTKKLLKTMDIKTTEGVAPKSDAICAVAF
ncbi:hypothetical protein MTR67_014014 [Solanum verrucosum]|uniref:Uncharacterized protein n=1 Tax=Solanum verrucosum TaxID=315347 RepID=A0AAF0QIN4_SOLVR|nr:hypothetical protein MTR67_014014 [Solanum verrucosum]